MNTINVLIIEDCEADVALLTHMLKEGAPEAFIYIVNSPRLAEAFKLVERGSYDIILLDLNLIDIQGVASVAALHAESPDTPIIVYSGMDDPKLQKEAILCGAHSYLVKGNQTPDSLAEVIHSALVELPAYQF